MAEGFKFLRATPCLEAARGLFGRFRSECGPSCAARLGRVSAPFSRWTCIPENRLSRGYRPRQHTFTKRPSGRNHGRERGIEGLNLPKPRSTPPTATDSIDGAAFADTISGVGGEGVLWLDALEGVLPPWRPCLHPEDIGRRREGKGRHREDEHGCAGGRIRSVHADQPRDKPSQVGENQNPAAMNHRFELFM